MRVAVVCLLLVAAVFGRYADAKEGLYLPEQLAQVSEALQLSAVPNVPLAAVVELSGCTGAFVSSSGLVLTNHHCIRDSLQYHSNSQINYVEQGLVASSRSQELPAQPGTRLFITEAITDVTAQMVQATDNEVAEKLVQRCEASAEYVCEVKAFSGGMGYRLIKKRVIRDLRIAYAPAASIAHFGGESDHWSWPRHSGNFALYRAYVGQDGRSGATYHPDNVPFNPPSVLPLSLAPKREGDFVMVAGYPQNTHRYARMAEVKHTFNWLYPTNVELVEKWIDVIAQAAPKGSEQRAKYQGRLSRLQQFLRNTQGQIASATRSDLVERRELVQTEFMEWLAAGIQGQQYSITLATLDALIAERIVIEKQLFWYKQATRSKLLAAAHRIYTYAVEQTKPDDERQSSYQERNRDTLSQQLLQLENQYDPVVDKAEWQMFLTEYVKQPTALRSAILDNALAAGVDGFYRRTRMHDTDFLLTLFKSSKQELEQSTEPFIQLAVQLHNYDLQMTQRLSEINQKISDLAPEYTQSLQRWHAAQRKIMYPDANGSLRLAMGEIYGGSPRDGLIYEPFTRVSGILERNTGRAPFNAPQKQLTLIRQQAYGTYIDPVLMTVPVNFITSIDAAGGNSGSPTLNINGELVGLLFDSTVDGVNAKWDFYPQTTRAIHVDTRYMLWVMQYIDNATNIVNELNLVGLASKE